MKPDDEILRPADYEFYRIVQKWEPPKTERSAEQLTLDAYKAHDNIKMLVIERDRLQKAVAILNRSVEREKKWRNWITTGLILTWTVIYGVTKVVAPLIIKGLTR